MEPEDYLYVYLTFLSTATKFDNTTDRAISRTPSHSVNSLECQPCWNMWLLTKCGKQKTVPY